MNVGVAKQVASSHEAAGDKHSPFLDQPLDAFQAFSLPVI